VPHWKAIKTLYERVIEQTDLAQSPTFVNMKVSK